MKQSRFYLKLKTKLTSVEQNWCWPSEDEDISDSIVFAGLVIQLDYYEEWDEEVVVVVAGVEAVVVAGAAEFLLQLWVQKLHTQNHKFHPPLYPRDNLTAIKRMK